VQPADSLWQEAGGTACHPPEVSFSTSPRSTNTNTRRLAKMISLVEANQAWLESTAYQMSHMSYAQQSKLLGGPIGLLKSYATRSAHEIADDAVNIFGGRGLTQSGMGRVVEQFHRTYKFDAILGGTEEILSDLGVRQAYKNFPKSML
jgi:alkylation response protein AidB-like acyl-CoA dehydrogenase